MTDDRDNDQSSALSGAGPGWNWQRVPRKDAPAIVKQAGEDWCGPACGEMLLLDRGIHVDQLVIAARLGLPADAEDLASCLEDVSNLHWTGGAVNPTFDDVWSLVLLLSSLAGSWAALLEPHGFRGVGHWVDVDGGSAEGTVLVRDPSGAAYGIPLADFAELWRYTIVVMEKRAP